MANINLLPWREELREERKQEFLIGIGIAVALAGAVIFGCDRFVNNSIDNQNELNNYLRSQIALLDEEIAEIRVIQRQKSELTERMSVIQDLQGRRPVIVRLFDELVRTMPDGVYYDRISSIQDKINFQGLAESNNRVSALLRSLDDSEWFESPGLRQISSDQQGAEGNIFELTVLVTTPVQEE